jgi:hypothetical protein
MSDQSDQSGQDDQTDQNVPTSSFGFSFTQRGRERARRRGLRGFMGRPVTKALRVRRSTVLMVVAFLGFGALTLEYPPKSTTTPKDGSGTFVIPGVTPSSTTTTTSPSGR